MPSGIPDHGFDGKVANGEGFGAKLNPEGALVVIGELVVDEAEEEGALADTWVGANVLALPTRMYLNNKL